MISHILGMERNFTCRVGEEMDNNEGEGLILTMFGMHFLGVGNLSSSSSYPRALLSYLILHTIIDVVVFRFLAILSRKSLFYSSCWELELQSCPRLRQAGCVKGAYGAVGSLSVAGVQSGTLGQRKFEFDPSHVPLSCWLHRLRGWC